MNNDLKWTEDIPSEKGYYWRRSEKEDDWIVWVSEDQHVEGGFRYAIRKDGYSHFIREGNAKWAGPIAKPEDDTQQKL